MKKVLLSISLAAGFVFTYANPVNVQTAQAVAIHFLSSKGIDPNRALQLTKTYTSTSIPAQTSLYIFSVSNGKGFVIVSGDDAIKPILGYSTENIFPQQVTNKEVAYWMDGYNQQISHVIETKMQGTPAIAAQWNSLITSLQGNSQTSNKPTDVSPMILTEWDQWDPYGGNNTLYNNLCPSDAPTGCVATAMAQIMKFWENPTTGSGLHSYTSNYGGFQTVNFGTTTYDWANMPNTLLNGPSTAEIDAVATLMYHCGVSVDMTYGYGSSGAWVITFNNNICSENALKDFFGYKSTIQGNVRAKYTDPQWIKMLKFELDNGRPLLYVGWGQQGGHAFDFDGYDNNDNFHINWGWSGQGNGYFTIDNLDPFFLGAGGGSGAFNDNQQALIMIEPANSTLPPNPYGTLLSIAANITQTNDTIVFESSYTVTAKIKNKGTADFTNGGLTLVAEDVTNSNNIILLEQRTADIAPNANYNFSYTTDGNSDLVPGTYKMTYNYSVGITDPAIIPDGTGANGILLTVINKPTGVSNASMESNKFLTYPNPASDFINISWNGYNSKISGIQLFNILGQEVYHSEMITGTKIKIPVSGFSSGNYTLRIVTEKGTISRKVSVK